MVELLHCVPIIIFLALPATFIITYIWAVCNKHVHPLLPNISDTGSLPPESCLFSMIMNLTVALSLFSLYIRHKEVILIFRAKNAVETIPFSATINTIATILGLIACIALDVLANFQETGIFVVHGVGALICFWSSAAYVILQTLITYWITPEITCLFMVFIRGFLGICVIALTICTTVTGSISLKEFPFDRVNKSRILTWTPDLPGWKMHVASSGSEWVLVVALSLFMLTFYWDFKKITIYAPELIDTEQQSQPITEEQRLNSGKVATIPEEDEEEYRMADDEV